MKQDSIMGNPLCDLPELPDSNSNLLSNSGKKYKLQVMTAFDAVRVAYLEYDYDSLELFFERDHSAHFGLIECDSSKEISAFFIRLKNPERDKDIGYLLGGLYKILQTKLEKPVPIFICDASGKLVKTFQKEMGQYSIDDLVKYNGILENILAYVVLVLISQSSLMSKFKIDSIIQDMVKKNFDEILIARSLINIFLGKEEIGSSISIPKTSFGLPQHLLQSSAAYVYFTSQGEKLSFLRERAVLYDCVDLKQLLLSPGFFIVASREGIFSNTVVVNKDDVEACLYLALAIFQKKNKSNCGSENFEINENGNKFGLKGDYIIHGDPDSYNHQFFSAGSLPDYCANTLLFHAFYEELVSNEAIQKFFVGIAQFIRGAPVASTAPKVRSPLGLWSLSARDSSGSKLQATIKDCHVTHAGVRLPK